MNPLIYPSWWGDDSDNSMVVENVRDNSKKYGKAKEHEVNQDEIEVKRRRFNGRDDCSLDQRLQEAKVAAAKLEQMFHSRKGEVSNQQKKEESLSPPPTKTFYHNMAENEKYDYNSRHVSNDPSYPPATNASKQQIHMLDEFRPQAAQV